MCAQLVLESLIRQCLLSKHGEILMISILLLHQQPTTHRKEMPVWSQVSFYEYRYSVTPIQRPSRCLRQEDLHHHLVSLRGT